LILGVSQLPIFLPKLILFIIIVDAYVAPDNRKLGVCRTMMKTHEVEAISSRVKKIEATIGNPNIAEELIGMFEKLGYTVIGNRTVGAVVIKNLY
jgi:hypothetical protein